MPFAMLAALFAHAALAWLPLPQSQQPDFSLPASLPSSYEPGYSSPGLIFGRVALENLVPPKKILVTKDADKCGKEKLDETFIYSANKGLKNVVVWLEGIRRGKTSNKPAPVLRHMTCVYDPRVMVATVGSMLEIKNYDAVQHNSHGYLLPLEDQPWTEPRGAPDPRLTIFNISFPVKGLSVRRRLEKAGLIDLLNDAGHPWMQAWLWVFDHPYAEVTDENGEFRIEGVPAGQYTLKTWHEALGFQSRPVTVGPGDAKVEVNLVY